MLLRQFSDQQTTGSDVINNLQCHFTLALSASSGYPHSALRSLGVAGALSDQLTHSLLVHDHQMVRTDTSGIATTGCDQLILDVQSQQRGHVATHGPLSLVLTVGDCHLRCSIGRTCLLPQPAVSILYASPLNVFDGHVYQHVITLPKVTPPGGFPISCLRVTEPRTMEVQGFGNMVQVVCCCWRKPPTPVE